jgi:hypothetical protein
MITQADRGPAFGAARRRLPTGDLIAAARQLDESDGFSRRREEYEGHEEIFSNQFVGELRPLRVLVISRVLVTAPSGGKTATRHRPDGAGVP